ncbi:hypothetical protein [Pseudoalteromonas phenolica]|uniref:hypothetical protein n=1 Tax=Pseudoalteromonas phenolica TaxID=161398 RepID=UPI00110C107C|nr:hypothetical protein [Pseudoalteromonas phenolica]TMO56753.1 hypothetical protein CWC21_06160 [Pseudoalteromonas phenolica]
MFNKLILVMAILLNSNLANSASNEMSIGIAVKENKYIADIKGIVTQAYGELDKTVIWKNLPTSRSLRLTNKGKLDAEFLRVSSVADGYKDLIKINTPLIYASINLYCKTPRDCEMALQGRIPVGYNMSYKIYEQVCKKEYLSCYGVNTNGDPHVLFKHNKLDAILSNDLEIAASLSSLEQVLFKSKKLEDVTGHHYINKKHKSLAQSLEAQFSKSAKQIRGNSQSITDLVKNNRHIEQLDF